MTDLTYDPELPFVVLIREDHGQLAILARFKEFSYADQFVKAGTRLREIVDTTPKPKIPEDAQHITWGQGRVAYSRYEGQWVGWTHGYAISEEELLTWIGEDEVIVLVRKGES